MPRKCYPMGAQQSKPRNSRQGRQEKKWKGKTERKVGRKGIQNGKNFGGAKKPCGANEGNKKKSRNETDLCRKPGVMGQLVSRL